MSVSSTWTTRANGLTLLRLLALPAFVHAVLVGDAGSAAALFGLAIASDLADGWVARRYGEASHFGGLADHAADALFVTAGSAAFAWRGELPAWLPLLIAVAFAQYALDSRPGPHLRGSSLGRWNGIAYFVALGVPTARDALGLGWPPAPWVRVCGWLLCISTLLSIADRLRHTRGSPLFPISKPLNIRHSAGDRPKHAENKGAPAPLDLD